MRQIPNDVLFAMQHHFYKVIRGRAGKLVDEHNLALAYIAPAAAGHNGKEAVPEQA